MSYVVRSRANVVAHDHVHTLLGPVVSWPFGADSRLRESLSNKEMNLTAVSEVASPQTMSFINVPAAGYLRCSTGITDPAGG